MAHIDTPEGMSAFDARVFSVIQSKFPLTHDPYATLAEMLGEGSAEDVYDAVMRLREKSVRRIGATFDPAHLGYTSTLACVEVAHDEDIEQVAAAINKYPEVTHNYLRNDAFNLWFTVIASSRERIEEILDEIRALPQTGPVLMLPTLTLFKIRVNFNMARLDDAVARDTFKPEPIVPREVTCEVHTEEQRALVRALQLDIGTSRTPYMDIAHDLGMSEDDLLATMQEWKSARIIRRFGAVVRHRKVGSSVNSMTVWNVPDEKVREAGMIMARFDSVSHCYERPRYPEWPANLYTMIHASDMDRCTQSVHDIYAALQSAGIPVDEPRMLISSKEFKKRSMRYFMEKEQ